MQGRVTNMVFLRRTTSAAMLGRLAGLYIMGEEKKKGKNKKKGGKKKKQSDVGGVDPTIRQETAVEMVWVTLSKK